VSVTAFEAKDRSSLRNPSRFAAYGISGLYFICFLLETVVVNWRNTHLPTLQERSAMQVSTDNTWPSGQGFYAIIVIAARLYGSAKAGWFFNACIIYFCITASNTALYVASRTLFGLTREINRLENPSWYLRVFAYFGVTSPFARVPHWALIFSAVAFFWLPLLHSTSTDVRAAELSFFGNQTNRGLVANNNEYDKQHWWRACLGFPVCCVYQIPPLVPPTQEAGNITR
jgi:yeast amino acid transporter